MFDWKNKTFKQFDTKLKDIIKRYGHQLPNGRMYITKSLIYSGLGLHINNWKRNLKTAVEGAEKIHLIEKTFAKMENSLTISILLSSKNKEYDGLTKIERVLFQQYNNRYANEDNGVENDNVTDKIVFTVNKSGKIVCEDTN